MHIYYTRGLWGQYVICIPEKDMIIVRLGQELWFSFGRWTFKKISINLLMLHLEMYLINVKSDLKTQNSTYFWT